MYRKTHKLRSLFFDSNPSIAMKVYGGRCKTMTNVQHLILLMALPCGIPSKPSSSSSDGGGLGAGLPVCWLSVVWGGK